MTTLKAGEKTPQPDITKKPFKLSLQQKNWVLSFHISFAALWTGTVLSMFLIALRNKDTTDADILFALNSVINLLDDVVVIPAAIRVSSDSNYTLLADQLRLFQVLLGARQVDFNDWTGDFWNLLAVSLG